MTIEFEYELYFYREDYFYAYIKVLGSDVELRKWVEDQGHDIEENSEDTPSGWDYIINLHGKGAGAMFKLQWAEVARDKGVSNRTASKEFMRILGIK